MIEQIKSTVEVFNVIGGLAELAENNPLEFYATLNTRKLGKKIINKIELETLKRIASPIFDTDPLQYFCNQLRRHLQLTK